MLLVPPPDVRPVLPDELFPIVIIGAGGIVKDAHLPAYQLAKFPVWGICDKVRPRAEALATQYKIDRIFDSIDDVVANAPADAVYDLALPASAFAKSLIKIPTGSHVLIQKPMGEDIAQARKILHICRERELKAAVNCQLRFAPFVVAARKIIDEGRIGDLLDIEMRLTTMTPWELFPFLEDLPRVEMVYHSIHYIDLIRSFFGNPRSVYARTVSHPRYPRLASVCSTIILDYPDPVRATITTNHVHRFGARHQESYLKWEGTRGVVKERIGLLMNYPEGVGDSFEVCLLDDDGSPGEWQTLTLQGSWFPEAFIGLMAQVQCHKAGIADSMPTDVEDIIHTMEVVEAAYASSQRGGVQPSEFAS